MTTTENNETTVEMGGESFTQAQWEAVQRYAKSHYFNMEREFTTMQLQVREFHWGMGQPVGLFPRDLPADRVPVRVELIREEFEDELIPALQQGDMVETVDACIDLLYVVFGLLVEMGVNATPLFQEVHNSNMSKFGEDGKPIIAGPNDPDGVFEGRVKKGPYYFRPKLGQILASGSADLGKIDLPFYKKAE